MLEIWKKIHKKTEVRIQVNSYQASKTNKKVTRMENRKKVEVRWKMKTKTTRTTAKILNKIHNNKIKKEI